MFAKQNKNDEVRIEMKAVLNCLKQYLPLSSGAEKGVITYIIDHPEEATKISIHNLSSLSFSSASTIVRLCHKLGFEGYRDMQSSLIRELILYSKNLSERVNKIDRFSNLKETIQSVTFRNISSLEDSMELLDEQSLSNCINIIDQCQNLFLFGVGSSQLVAQDAMQKFIRIGKPCTCCGDTSTQYIISCNSHKTDAAIIISYSGYTEEILNFANNLYNNNTPIIAITRYDNSPLSRIATCILHTVAIEDLFRSGAMSSRISQLNVVDILYSAFFNLHYEENLRKIEQNQIVKKGASKDNRTMAK